MYRNKNYNIEEALTYILDGESDFEDLNDSDSDFEPEDVTVNEVDVDFVASNPDELVQHQNVSVDLEDHESFDQACNDFSDNDNEPLANMVKNKNKPVTVKRLWKKVDINDVGHTTFHDLRHNPNQMTKLLHTSISKCSLPMNFLTWLRSKLTYTALSLLVQV